MQSVLEEQGRYACSHLIDQIKNLIWLDTVYVQIQHSKLICSRLQQVVMVKKGKKALVTV